MTRARSNTCLSREDDEKGRMFGGKGVEYSPTGKEWTKSLNSNRGIPAKWKGDRSSILPTKGLAYTNTTVFKMPDLIDWIASLRGSCRVPWSEKARIRCFSHSQVYFIDRHYFKPLDLTDTLLEYLAYIQVC